MGKKKSRELPQSDKSVPTSSDQGRLLLAMGNASDAVGVGVWDVAEEAAQSRMPNLHAAVLRYADQPISAFEVGHTRNRLLMSLDFKILRLYPSKSDIRQRPDFDLST